MSSSSFFQLAASISYLLYLSHGASSFDIIQTSPKQNVAVNSTLRLHCKTDSYYEYCTWRHQSQVCEFEWKKNHDKVLKQRCNPYLNNRIKFKGNYEGHECLIELKNVRPEDAGEWKCEMESYVWGIGRGYTRKKAMEVQVTSNSDDGVSPRILEETTTKAPSTTTTETTSTTTSTESPSPSSTQESEVEVTTPMHDVVAPRILEEATTKDDFDEDHHNDTDTSDQALVSKVDGSEQDEGSGNSYVGYIVGTFFAIFALMLIVAFFGYRQYRRQGKGGAHWEGLSRDEDDLEENATADPIIRPNARLELTNIAEEEETAAAAEREKVQD